jgi:hypothetical protein
MKSIGADTLTATYGSFSDGSSPRVNYANNTNRSWLISPQGGRNVTQITLKTAYFATEENNDVVTIYSGNTANPSNIVEVLSGEITNRTININSSQAFVTFTSDVANADKGFKFTYTSNITSDSLCPSSNPTPGQYIKDTAGVVSVFNADGYDDANMCLWAIIPNLPNNGKRYVDVKFTAFDLAQGDVVEVYKWDGTTPWNNLKYASAGAHRFTKDNHPVLNKTHTIIAEGIFICFKTDNNLNKSGFSLNWEGKDDLSVHESSIGLSNISIYPNPATDRVRLQVETLQPETLQIAMYDIVGRTVYTTALQGNDNQISQDIDISKFAKGIYMLQIATSKGKITKKLVIQ